MNKLAAAWTSSQIQLVEASVPTRHLVFLVAVIQVVDSERALVATLVEEILVTAGRHANNDRAGRVRSELVSSRSVAMT